MNESELFNLSYARLNFLKKFFKAKIVRDIYLKKHEKTLNFLLNYGKLPKTNRKGSIKK